jgi:hypothetical protein
MARKLLLIVLALASCSKGPQADLPYIGEARSLAAEWALVNEQAGLGHVTDNYTRTMRAAVRQQLQTSRSSLTEPRSAYADEISALLKEPDEAPPERLRAHADKLKQIEDSLESA